MLYILAVLLPPVAALLIGRPFSALLLLAICVSALITFGLSYTVAAIIAVILVAQHRSDKKHREMLNAVRSKPSE